MYDDYIAHYGIPNQRWGVRHGPPYPVVRGAGGKPKLTSVVKSKLKESAESRAESQAAKKKAKADAVERAKQRRLDKKAEKEVSDREKLRERVVQRPKELYKHRSEFSKDEMTSILKDIEFDRKLKDVRASDYQRGLESFQRLRNYVNTTANLASDMKNIYNIAADVNNALIDAGKSNGKKWQKLGGKDNQQKKKDDNSDS